MGTVSSPYLPFSVNVTHVILHSRPADMKSLARIILFSEELDALMLLPHASMASLDHFLMVGTPGYVSSFVFSDEYHNHDMTIARWTKKPKPAHGNIVKSSKQMLP